MEADVANVLQIYKCESEDCARPGCYKSYSSDKEDRPPCEVPGCGSRMKLLRCVYNFSLFKRC